MANLTFKDYAVADLFNGTAGENGNNLFWLGKMASINAVLEKDYLANVKSQRRMLMSSVVGIFTGIACVKDEFGSGDWYYRLSIGNEIVIAPVSSRISIFSVS